jgi:hypothetical protein
MKLYQAEDKRKLGVRLLNTRKSTQISASIVTDLRAMKLWCIYFKVNRIVQRNAGSHRSNMGHLPGVST